MRARDAVAAEEEKEQGSQFDLHFADHMLPEIISRSFINLETATKRSSVLLRDIEESDTELRDLELRYRDVTRDLERAKVDLDEAKREIVGRRK